MKLYELNKEYEDLLAEIDDAVAGSEDGVVPEELAERLYALDDAIESKCENIVKAVRNYEADAKAYKDQIKVFTDKARATDKRIAWLKKYLLDTLRINEAQKIRAGAWGVSVRKTKSVEITDESVIPDDFYETTRKIKIGEIHKALDTGVEIPGATLVENESVAIK